MINNSRMSSNRDNHTWHAPDVSSERVEKYYKEILKTVRKNKSQQPKNFSKSTDQRRH